MTEPAFAFAFLLLGSCLLPLSCSPADSGPASEVSGDSQVDALTAGAQTAAGAFTGVAGAAGDSGSSAGASGNGGHTSLAGAAGASTTAEAGSGVSPGAGAGALAGAQSDMAGSGGAMVLAGAGQASAGAPPVAGDAAGGGAGGGEGGNGGGAGSAPVAGGAGAGDAGLAGAAGSGTDPEPVVGENIWVGTWATGPQLTEDHNLPPDPRIGGYTVRQVVPATLEGQLLRLHLSNEWGEAPLTISAASVALSAGADRITEGTAVSVQFAGAPSVTIAAGGTAVSDPFSFDLAPLSRLAITLSCGEQAPTAVTGHPGSRTTSYLVKGAGVADASLAGAASTEHWYFITGVDVEAPPSAGAVVALGDSITDGRGSTTDQQNRWTDKLAQRLQQNAATQEVAVLNQGIGGNRVLRQGLGPTALERFQRDVLDQRGVRWLIVLEGVNDIGEATDESVADELIAAFQQMIEQAHAAGIKVYGVPILPFGNSDYDSTIHENARLAVNTWIRESGAFDAVLDLDAAVADPNNARRLASAYDSGDSLHLSPAGYAAMADAIDLALFAD